MGPRCGGKLIYGGDELPDPIPYLFGFPASGEVVHVLYWVGRLTLQPAPPIFWGGSGGVCEGASMDEFGELVGVSRG